MCEGFGLMYALYIDQPQRETVTHVLPSALSRSTELHSLPAACGHPQYKPLNNKALGKLKPRQYTRPTHLAGTTTSPL